MIQSAEDYWRDARALGEEEFLQRHPDPVLLLEPFGSTESPGYHTRASGSSDGVERGVAVLKKREGSNAFAMMITIGRARNNDVCIPCNDISKFHAYLVRKPNDETLFFADAGSTFGSTVDGRRLEPREPVLLAAGAKVRLSSVQGVFFTPETLREHLLRKESA